MRKALLLILALVIQPAFGELSQSALEEQTNSILTDLLHGESASFAANFDMETLADRVIDGGDFNALVATTYKAALVQQKPNMAQNIASVFGDATSGRHLWTRQNATHYSLLYRIDFGDDGMNFYRFVIAKDTGQIVDWFEYISGRLASENMRVILEMNIGANSLGTMFSSMFSDNAHDQKRYAAMVDAIENDNFAEVLAQFEGGSEAFKQTTPPQDLLVNAASHTDGDLAVQMLSNVAKYGGDNPRFAFSLLDHHVVNGDYQAAIDSVNVLQKDLGIIEAGLVEQKAYLYALLGDYEAAAEQFMLSAETEPDRAEPYEGLFEVYVETRQFAQAARAIDILNDDFEYGIEIANLSEDYPEFTQWVAANPG